jgi:hypothetical protein
MSTLQVPLELLFEVLSHLSARQIEDADTLRASALVSSSLRAFCQKKLFARILLHTGADKETGETGPCCRLVEIFSESPHLVSYVRSLVVRDDFEWVRHEKSLPWVLRTLSTAPIAAFTCIFDAWTSWENNPEATRIALLDICRLPSLVHLHVSGMPLGALPLGNTTLKCLWIESGNEVEEDNVLEEPIPTGCLAPKIEDLLLSDQETLDFIAHPNSNLDIQSLRSLTVRTSILRDFRPILQPLLSLCRLSLTELHLGSHCTSRGSNSRRQAEMYGPL